LSRNLRRMGIVQLYIRWGQNIGWVTRLMLKRGCGEREHKEGYHRRKDVIEF
jgi:hypothetical protein